MLDLISEGFRRASDKFRGKTTLSEDNVAAAIEEIRRSLLEGDVEIGVARGFLDKVKERALGQEVRTRAGVKGQKVQVTAGDHFVDICRQELEKLMGPESGALEFPGKPTVIMMVGLQGTGKTTTSGKLAKFLQRKHGKKPLLAAADTHRPAAADQLAVLGQRIGVPVFHKAGASAVAICQEAVKEAQKQSCDVVILDTAGRLTIDSELMDELKAIHKKTSPHEVLLVCDAMMGQDAVTTAQGFRDQLPLSGFIMTKLDGDARGGAALSIKAVTGKPIRFLGSGEELDRLEEFRPEGLASRILGMGDVTSLMEDFERAGGEEREDETRRLLQGQFNFKDFYRQISLIQKMGPLKEVMAKLPGMGRLPKEVNLDDSQLGKIKSMIDSMTEKERLSPQIITPSRARRIARGSGRAESDVRDLIKRFVDMRKMMGKMGKMMGGMPGMGGGGGMPTGLGGMPGMPPGMAGLPGAPAPAARRVVDRDKQRKARKAAKRDRKKNRKR